MIGRGLLCALLAAAGSAAQDSRPHSRNAAPAGLRSEHHDHLDAFTGEWDVTSKVRGSETEAWREQSFAERDEWLANRLWLLTLVKGAGEDGAYLGLGLTGYDTVADRYVGLWLDSGTGHLTRYVGSCAQSGKKLLMWDPELPGNRIENEVRADGTLLARTLAIDANKQQFLSAENTYARSDRFSRLDVKTRRQIATRTLEPYVGEFLATVRVFAAPGQEPVVSKGVMTNRVVCTADWLESRFAGQVLGVPMQGYGLTGFDGKTERWVGVWVDSTSTWLGISAGKQLEGRRALEFRGRVRGFDGVLREQRAVTEVIDADQHTYTTYVVQAGAEQKTMEVTYTRQK